MLLNKPTQSYSNANLQRWNSLEETGNFELYIFLSRYHLDYVMNSNDQKWSGKFFFWFWPSGNFDEVQCPSPATKIASLFREHVMTAREPEGASVRNTYRMGKSPRGLVHKEWYHCFQLDISSDQTTSDIKRINFFIPQLQARSLFLFFNVFIDVKLFFLTMMEVLNSSMHLGKEVIFIFIKKNHSFTVTLQQIDKFNFSTIGSE